MEQVTLDAARAAADEGPWPHLPHAERAALLHRFADEVRGRARGGPQEGRRGNAESGRRSGQLMVAT
jgi:hypothetical protein